MRIQWPGFEFRMKLGGDKKWMLIFGELNYFD